MLNAVSRLSLQALALASTFAYAQEGGTAPMPGAAPDPVKGLLLNLPVFLALFALFYFGLIRPQRNQQKKQLEFLQTLNRGDEVVTSSGIIGTIRGLTDRVVTLEVSQGTEMKVLRSQIQSHLKDTLQA